MNEHDNIRLICSEHADQSHQEWQKNNWNTPIKAGDYVKMAFKNMEGRGIERMWVKVTKACGNDNFIGILYNDPILATHLKHGEEVFFQRKHISELL